MLETQIEQALLNLVLSAGESYVFSVHGAKYVSVSGAELTAFENRVTAW